MIKHRYVLLTTLFVLITTGALAGGIEAGFQSPPPETRPGCYWYFLKDDVTKAGITRDLEAMARVGIGRAFIGYINQGMNPPGDNHVLSEIWWDRLEHTFLEADRVGVDIGLFNCPGWSQSGGPWIPLERSMRSLVHTEVNVSGPAAFDDVLPRWDGYFETVKVLAFPAPPQERVTMRGAGVKISGPAAEAPPHFFAGGSVGFRSTMRFPDDPGNPAGVVRRLRVLDGNGRVLAEDGFTDGLMQWRVQGESRVEEEGLLPRMTDNPPMHIRGLELPEKFSVEIEVKLNEGGLLGIAMGVRDAANHAFWQLGPGKLRPHFRVNGQFEVHEFPVEAIKTGEWLSMRFVCDGDVMRTYVGDAMVNEVSAQARGNTASIDALFDGDPGTTFAFPGIHSRRSAIELNFDFAEPYTVQSLIAEPALERAGIRARLYASEDGADYRLVSETEMYHGRQGVRTLDPIAAAVPSTTARHFRLRVVETRGEVVWRSLTLSPRAVVDKYAIKQLGDIHPEPHPYYGTYEWEAQPEPDLADSVVAADAYIDLTDRISEEGRLRWKVPSGEWVIARFGMVNTGSRNGPAMPDATGPEVDKMSAEHVRFHFEQYVGEVLERIPAENRRRFKYVIQDSYEKGPQNWTDGFIEIFRERYQYDPVPFLPAMTGRVVRSAEASERFLWDLRRLVADLIATEYVGGLTAAAEAHGLRGWLENYGHWGFPGESLLYGKHSTEVGGEFWLGGNLGAIEIRPASSCANIYGKPEVFAEAFTAGIRYVQTPRSHFKHYGDWAFSHGINHLILHVNIHQPREERPGVDAWFSTNFHRHNTWFELSKGYMDYTRRVNYMMRRGVHVADVCYFVGEGAPKMDGPMTPKLPRGYDFDFVNGDVILHSMLVEDGRLRIPGGPSYKVMVLPPVNTMRPAIAARLEDFVEGGVIVCGPRPERSPSLENYPACDAELAAIADRLWGTGKVSNAEDLRPLLGGAHVPPDFAYTILDAELHAGESPWMDMSYASSPQGNSLRYYHRREEGMDTYFVANMRQDRGFEAECTFRVAGKKPEIWDPVSGEIRRAAAYRLGASTVTLPVAFAPQQSFLFVFRDAAAGDGTGTTNVPVKQELAALPGPWQVRFDASMGAPEMETFETLSSWHEHGHEGIKYYSGEAVYETRFDLARVPPGRAWLNLGNVADLARVVVNGSEAGYVWVEPWEIEITGLIRPGMNTLSVTVASTWNNRIFGDHATGAKYAHFHTPHRPGGLHEAGLLGPVTISVSPGTASP